MGLTNIHRTLHIAAEYIFLLRVHEILSRIDHRFSHKTSFSNFNKTEIIPNIFSDNHGKKLEIKNRRKTGNFTKMRKLNDTQVNNQWVK